VPIGCSKLDKFEAILAVQYWDMLLPAIPSQTYLTVPEVYTEDTWAVPWYLWRSWWDSLVDSTSPWAPYYYQTFRIIDINNDGYASMTELTAARDALEPRCPSGYYKSALVVVGCNPFSGMYNVTLLANTTQGEINLPAYTDAWSYSVTSMVSRSDIVMKNASGYVIVDTESASRVNTSRSGTWSGGGNVAWVSDGDYAQPPYIEYLKVLGKTTKAVDLHIVSSVSGDGASGELSFSHQGVDPCPTIPSGCSVMDEPLALTATDVWVGELLNKGYTADSAWLWADSKGYVVFGWGITADKWNVMWREVLNPASTFNMAGTTADSSTSAQPARRLLSPTVEEKMRLWTVLEEYDRMSFDYCDDNTDFMVTKPEFTACFETLLTCPTGSIMANPILFACKAHAGQFTHGASVGRNYTLFIIPGGANDFRARMGSIEGNSALAPGFMFSLNSTLKCSLLNNDTEISCPGNLTEVAVSVTLHTPATEDDLPTMSNTVLRGHYVSISYSYGALLRLQCPSSKHWGCVDYDVPLAESQLLIWSQQINNEYPSAGDAWTHASKYSIRGLGIPFSNWLHLGCRLAVAPCSLESLGNTFHKADINMNGYIDDASSGSPEFAIAFRMSGVHVTNINPGCFVTAQFAGWLFPLPTLRLPPSCGCNRKLGIGWNPSLEKCVLNADTNCADCPNQPKCAYIETAIGDGFQDFVGDCVHLDTSHCLQARKVSLSNPVSIAVDEYDNIYIADYGNNRVRMVNAAENRVTTIAGNGLPGFSGDGGHGRDAQLRHPESVTVNIVGCTSAAREVYFSDSLNQRIRKVVQSVDGTGENWTIFTVAGTGEKGENSDCNTLSSSANGGCPALEAIFFNPRAVSLASNGDLYIADSGNRKIRRLRNGIISTFVGSGLQFNTRVWTSLKEKESLLPGHWSELNEDVAFESLYFLKVDHEDNLWFVDGGNHRIFMAPLEKKVTSEFTGLVGIYDNNYRLHFLDRSQMVNVTLRTKIAQGLITWLRVEGLITENPGYITHESTYEVGRSYWLYAKTNPGSWCEKKSFNSRAKCPSKAAQLNTYREIMGMCFAGSSEIYVADRKNSEIVKIYQQPFIKADDLQTMVEERRTTKDCACLKYWVDWQSLGSGPMTSTVSGPDLWRELMVYVDPQSQNSHLFATFCKENPIVQGYFEEIQSKTDASSDFWMKMLHLVPSCTVTNYCKQDAVPWCLINSTDLAPNHPCNPEDSGDIWGFCEQNDVPPVEWHELPTTALYANEIRDLQVSGHYMGKCDTCDIATFFSVLKSQIAWGNHQMLMSAVPDAGFHAGMPGFEVKQRSDMGVKLWSFLLGVKEPVIQRINGDFTPIHAIWNTTKMDGVNCNITCCGLATATDADGDQYCVIDSEEDFDVAENMAKGQYELMPDVVESDLSTVDFGNQPNQQVKLSMTQGLLAHNQRMIFVWKSPDAFTKFGTCQEKCELDPSCEAFMTYPQVPICVDDSVAEYCTGENYCAAPDKVNCGIQTFAKPDGSSFMCDCTGCGASGAGKQCTRADGVFNCVTYQKTHPYEVYTLDRTNMTWSAAQTTRPLIFGAVTDLFITDASTHHTPVTVFNWTSGAALDGYIAGPLSQQALLVDACKALCENHTLCVSMVNPGCYLFARSNWGNLQATFSPHFRTMVYSKVSTNDLVRGVAGLPGVFAFEGDMGAAQSRMEARSSLAARSLVNRPSSCAVNSKGHLLIADTWNQRIRKVSNLNQMCMELAELFSPPQIATWMAKVNNVTTHCRAAFDSDVFPGDTWPRIESEAVKDRIFPTMYRYVCHDESLINTELQTTNLQVLCPICESYNSSRPSLCPSEQLCMCRQAFLEALTTEVYLNCPKDSAFSDPWHRLLSAYLGCWAIPDVNIASFRTEIILESTIRQVLETGIST